MSVPEPPLRVLHMLYELRPSGAEVMLRVAAPLFRAAGVDAEILATGPDQLGPYAQALRDAGYAIHHIPFRRDLGSFLRIAKFMRIGSYDVIHIHTEGSNLYFGLAALLAARRKALRTIHNTFEFRGWLRIRRSWHRRIVHHLGLVHVAISSAVQRNEGSRFGNPTVLINNWYDGARFRRPTSDERREARRRLDIPEDRFVVVSVGNCSLVKNHGAIIEALGRMPREQRPLYLHAGVEEHGAPERALAERIGVAEHVRFLGSRGDVESLLFAADAYAMPSEFEGLSIAAIEALATGLPCVFSYCAGLRYFADLFPGIVYVQRDSASVASGLERLMKMSPTERTHITRDYGSIAAEHFGVEQGVRGYLEVYRGVVAPERIPAMGIAHPGVRPQ